MSDHVIMISILVSLALMGSFSVACLRYENKPNYKCIIYIILFVGLMYGSSMVLNSKILYTVASVSVGSLCVIGFIAFCVLMATPGLRFSNLLIPFSYKHKFHKITLYTGKSCDVRTLVMGIDSPDVYVSRKRLIENEFIQWASSGTWIPDEYLASQLISDYENGQISIDMIMEHRLTLYAYQRDWLWEFWKSKVYTDK